MNGEYWRDRILIFYSRRVLTRPRDILVALTAVASRLQSEFGLIYLAALWKEDLIKELLCYVERSWSAKDHAPICQDSFYAPTWSWTSVNGPMSWYPFDYNAVIQKPLAQGLGVFTNPSTLNPFGPVADGQIKLSSTVWQATAMYDGTNRWWTIFVTEIDESIGKDDIFSLIMVLYHFAYRHDHKWTYPAGASIG